MSGVNLDKFVGEVKECAAEYFRSEGFSESETEQYCRVTRTNKSNSTVVVRVYAELGVEGCLELAGRLSKIASRYNRDLYFDLEEPGILVCVVDGA